MPQRQVSKVRRERVWEDAWIPTLCHVCNRGPCSIVVHRVNGVLINIEGDPRFADIAKNRGRVCPKSIGQIQKVYNPNRVKSPLKRTNPKKGIDQDPGFVEISWDEALDTIAQRLKELREAGRTREVAAIGGGSPQRYTLSGTWSAFFNAYGPMGEMGSGNSIRCQQADHNFGNLIHGTFTCEPDLVHCDYFLAIGCNPASSGGVPEVAVYADCLARGMKMVVVDPVFTLTAAKADEWIPIKPQTDSAFLLALIHVILHEIGIYDSDFLKKRTNSPYLVAKDGYFVRDNATGKPMVWDSVDRIARTYDDPSIKDYALEGSYKVDGKLCQPAFQVMKEHMKQYTPEWAAKVTEVPAETLRRIAREWVDNAQIGSTIELDGVTLPYRPVATKMARGVTGVMRSYQTGLANHILAMLVGALEVVGGHGGGYQTVARPTKIRGIIPGADGMLKLDTYPWTWPPTEWEGVETLLPYGKWYGHMSHLAYLNLAKPPLGFPLPPPPQVVIKWHCSPMVAIGQPEIVAEVLSKIPLMVSLAYVIDETTWFADIVLPEHIDLERFELITAFYKAAGEKFDGFGLRQPVMALRHNTREISDIFTELARKIGMLPEYNEAVNQLLKLAEPYKLEVDKKYTWEEMEDRHCRSATTGKRGLDWFRKEGATLRSVPPAEKYGVHLKMVREKLRYPIPYMEHVKKTGEELTRHLKEVGVDWWDTSEYVPLPAYFPSVLEEVPADYDFYLTTAKSMLFAWGNNAEIPWMIESAPEVRGTAEVLMNRDAGHPKGIEDGDEVWVESEVGKVKAKVRLAEGIRPDTLVMASMFGQWATPGARDTGWANMCSLTPIKPEWTDHMTGGIQGQVIKVKIYKA